MATATKDCVELELDLMASFENEDGKRASHYFVLPDSENIYGVGESATGFFLTVGNNDSSHHELEKRLCEEEVIKNTFVSGGQAYISTSHRLIRLDLDPDHEPAVGGNGTIWNELAQFFYLFKSAHINILKANNCSAVEILRNGARETFELDNASDALSCGHQLAWISDFKHTTFVQLYDAAENKRHSKIRMPLFNSFHWKNAMSALLENGILISLLTSPTVDHGLLAFVDCISGSIVTRKVRYPKLESMDSVVIDTIFAESLDGIVNVYFISGYQIYMLSLDLEEIFKKEETILNVAKKICEEMAGLRIEVAALRAELAQNKKQQESGRTEAATPIAEEHVVANSEELLHIAEVSLSGEQESLQWSTTGILAHNLVTPSFTNILQTETSADIADKFIGEWRLSQQHNVDQFLSVVGLNTAERFLAKHLNATLTVNFKDGEWFFILRSAGSENATRFRATATWQSSTIGNLKGDSLFYWEGDRLVQEHRADSRRGLVRIERFIDNEQLVIVSSARDVKCQRVYERVVAAQHRTPELAQNIETF